MRPVSGAKAYSKIDVSSEANSRSPEELIALLLERACTCLRRASMLSLEDQQKGDLTARLSGIEEFHKSTGKALQIVVALREMLDMDTGGEVSQQLSETYTIIAKSIWKATRDRNSADLAKLHEALAELRSAWGSLETA